MLHTQQQHNIFHRLTASVLAQAIQLLAGMAVDHVEVDQSSSDSTSDSDSESEHVRENFGPEKFVKAMGLCAVTCPILLGLTLSRTMR